MTLNKKLLARWDDEVIRCRAYRHHWAPSRAAKISGGFDVVQVCEQCGSERILDLDNKGRVLNTRIRYRPGYLNKGQGRMDELDRGTVLLMALGMDIDFS